MLRQEGPHGMFSCEEGIAEQPTLAFQHLRKAETISQESGYTFGKAQCRTFSTDLYNFSGAGKPDPKPDSSYAQKLGQLCGQQQQGTTTQNDTALADLDPTFPASGFDNGYFSNLQNCSRIKSSSLMGSPTPEIVNRSIN
ncbi:hypothetical protein ACLOJK_025498 [Asimina triloba]